MYAKLINNKLEYAPRSVVVELDGRKIFNPQPQDFLQSGYKQLVYDVVPEITEYQYLTQSYKEEDNRILVSYTVIDMDEEQKEQVDKFKLEEQQALIQSEINTKIEQVKNIIAKKYQDGLNALHPYNEYYIKGMFADKYTVAYVTLIDSEADTINLSIYDSTTTLVNIDMNFEEFKPLYRAVKAIAVQVEKEYQQALADLSTLTTEVNPQNILDKLNKYIGE